ncbi:MAG: tetratricopeptide repeat protein, partial [Actinomycetota bacterium]|nr:tetratricopeptide repeat protein [Actinomycetota bacterium]
HALIAARIDRLPKAQKTVLQRAAVIGRVFSAGAVAHLTPDLDGGSDAALNDLLLREFIVEEPRPLVSGERALRFKHVLIRDVAYAGLAKAARAAHHQKFAAWLQERTGDDLLELRAYHLEQAATLVAELDGEPPPELTREAAEALEAAGRRALKRESFKSARRLFLRAVELEPTLERRYLAARAAWRLGDSRAVAREMEGVRSAAHQEADNQLEGLALTALADAALAQSADVAGARALVERALEVLADDDLAVRFEALMARANVASRDLDHEEMESALERALAVAQEAGREDLEASATRALASRYIHALELDAAEPLVDRTVELAEASGSALARAGAAHIRAQLDRARGRLEEAETGFASAHELYADVGTVSGAAKSLLYLGRVRRQRGDLGGARKALREAVKIMKSAGDRGYLCEALRSLAELAVLDGNLDEAERLALEAQDSVGPQDRVSISTTRLSLGLVRAAQGRDEDAEALLRQSLHELRVADAASAELEALDDLAAFLRARGREVEAAQLDERAEELTAPSAAPIA